MSVDRFLKGKEASKVLGVHQRTLYQWEEKKWIETKRTKDTSGMRLYNVDKYIRDKQAQIKKCICLSNDEVDKLGATNERLSISYVRVSSMGQKDDLERQEKLMMEKFPNNILIKDIGSGINLTRRGLLKIIDLAIEGKIKSVAVAYKDRLTRFGFELIEYLITKHSKGEIIIVNKQGEGEPEEELTRDILEIMNVFVAKMNGLRKYKKLKEQIVTSNK